MTAADPADDAVRLRAPRERVSPRARLMWIAGDTLRGVLVMAFLLLATGPWNWFDLPGWVLWLVGALLLAYAALVPQWRYLVHRWEVTDTAVYTQTGWLSQERRIAPISRVQTVDSERGPIEQLFKLANVTVTTASAAGPIKIDGLAAKDADQLVADLTARVGRTTGDAT